MNFSEKLIKLRRREGMSQEELAEKLDVTRQTISKWELNQTTPDMDKLVAISQLFRVSLDELVNEIGESKMDNSSTATATEDYKDGPIQKKNTKISITIFISGLLIALILCGVGFLRQNNAAKVNEERRVEAAQQSQEKIDAAKARYEVIEEELAKLQTEYDAVEAEYDSLNMTDISSFSQKAALITKLSDLSDSINKLKSEQFTIENADYHVIYIKVKTITYMIFYYIAAGVFVVLSLISLIYYLVTRKK